MVRLMIFSNYHAVENLDGIAPELIVVAQT